MVDTVEFQFASFPLKSWTTRCSSIGSFSIRVESNIHMYIHTYIYMHTYEKSEKKRERVWHEV